MLFLPRTNGNVLASTVDVTNMGVLYYARDYDDAASFTTTDLIQYQDCKTVTAYNAFSVWVRPKVSQTVYNTVATSAYAQGSPWLDQAYPAVPYYGVKVAWTVAGSTSLAYDVSAVYYCKFKQVR